MNDIIVVQHSHEAEQRASEVRARLHDVRTSLDDNFFTLCELLREAHKNAYHHIWGHSNFENWIESSDLDISPRQAYYYIGIAGKAEKLGLSRADIAAVKISKLKEIFTLDPAEHSEQMKELVAAASSSKLQAVSDRVKEIRTKSGRPNAGFYTAKFSTEIRETQERAYSLARVNYGDIVTPEGITKKASDTQCQELICVAYLNDSGNYPEGTSSADF